MAKNKNKTIRDIVNENDDLHFIKIYKHNKRDKSTWTFDVIDDTSKISGLSDFLSNYTYQIVTLRRKNHFFLSYKIFIDKDTYEYFVDCKKSMHKDTPIKFVKGLVDYSVLSNDISIVKNAPSFRFTLQEMKQKNIDNYLDLCYHFGEYSAIGTGLTRNIRNLVVLDIDVDCTQEDNQKEINDLLIKFAKCNSLPDFYIFNKESNHVQLQWLIQNLEYRVFDKDMINSTMINLINDNDLNKEVRLIGTDFTKLSDYGIDYRKYTLALTDIVDKPKFGDKNYRYWKAKNFYTALLGLYDLELKMPYYMDGRIEYHTREDMFSFFESKEERERYFSEAPTVVELYKKTKHLVDKYVKKIENKKVETIKDDDIKELEKEKKEKNYGISRNSFVLKCSRETTWESARKMNLRTPNDINSLSETERNIFKSRVKRIVKKKYNEENKKYKGNWPGTGIKGSKYKTDEFDSTFNGAFKFASLNINYEGYSDEQRKTSIESRHLKKELHLIIVDYIRCKSDKIKRNTILQEVNDILKQSGHKEISLSSLKRYINESKKLTSTTRKKLYTEIINNLDLRKKQLYSAIENNNNKNINICKKRLGYLNLNIIDELKTLT